jgi:two-component system, OmpR family, phosphate regulon response regulator PhoB
MKKVLIVDDQDAIRKMLRLTLSGRYELFEAAEASEAWETLRRVRPDAVILDIMMPGEMDGYQLCEKLRTDRDLRGTHVVMVTARGQDADRNKGMNAGADAYFVKPFSPLALARHLEETLAEKPAS